MNRERLVAEFERQLLAWKVDGGKKPTVRSIANACGISRQSIYRSHAVLVAKITELSNSNGRSDTSGLKIDLLRERLKREAQKVSLLTTLCGELAAALYDTREELAHTRAIAERLRAKRGNN